MSLKQSLPHFKKFICKYKANIYIYCIVSTMQCSICFDSIQSNKDTLAEIIPCEHKFHVSCIRTWQLHLMKRQQSLSKHELVCPLCRGEYSMMNIIYDYGTQFMKQVEVDVMRGFHVNTVTEWYKTGERLVQSMQEVQERGCLMCQESIHLMADGRTPNGDTLYKCIRCHDAYHQTCLQDVSLEIGDRESWRHCPRCRDHMEWCTNPEKIYQVKASIQKHVRDVLNPLYKGETAKRITHNQYTQLNKVISRHLYHISYGTYRQDTIDYTREANLQLEKLLKRDNCVT